MFENTDNFDVGYNYYEDPLDKIFEAFDTDPDLMALDEISYLERANKAILRLEVLDVDKYIKVLMKRDKMTEEQAWEHFDYNVLGSINEKDNKYPILSRSFKNKN